MRSLRGGRATPFDAVVALAITLASQVEIWAPRLMPGVGNDVAGSQAWLSLTTAAITLPLVLRRVAPVPVLVTVLAASVLQQAVTTPTGGLSVLAALMIASYTASAYAAPSLLLPSGLALALGCAVMGPDWGDRAFLAIVLGGAWLMGLVVGRRSEQVARLAHDNRDLVERLAHAAAVLAEAKRLEAAGAPPPTPDALASLTSRELDVVRALATGRSNAEIAAHLVISEWTVKTHVASILRKLGLRDRAQVVVAAYESGLLTPGS